MLALSLDRVTDARIGQRVVYVFERRDGCRYDLRFRIGECFQQHLCRGQRVLARRGIRERLRSVLADLGTLVFEQIPDEGVEVSVWLHEARRAGAVTIEGGVAQVRDPGATLRRMLLPLDPDLFEIFGRALCEDLPSFPQSLAEAGAALSARFGRREQAHGHASKCDGLAVRFALVVHMVGDPAQDLGERFVGGGSLEVQSQAVRGGVPSTRYDSEVRRFREGV
jgi:hypothetical protein